MQKSDENKADQGSNSDATVTKRPYRTPALTTYGSVRELTGTLSGVNTGDTNMMMNLPSDRAYKENVVQVGEHPVGFGLYLFDYKPEYRNSFGHGRQFGVMADEVETVMPEAVSLGEDGYRRVRYDLLGIVRH
jgi:hypothetical protein